MKLYNIAYSSPKDTNDWALAGVQDGQPMYVKELIYVGKFRQSNGVEFTVDEQLLSHWNDTTEKMLANGVSIPLPVNHTEDPEATRGHLVGTFVAKNLRGLPALFMKAKFRDEEAAKLAKTAQVSIFSPPEFVDGKGVRYVRPIRHVALTDYPVIPSLQGFESIAASLVTFQKEGNMPLKQLAKRLNITCESDEQLEPTIVASFETSAKAITEKDAQIASLQAEIAALKAKVPPDPVTVTAASRELLKDNRSMKLERLVESGKISPATRDKLASAFCSDEALTLALSVDRKDSFDIVLSALAENVTLPLGEAQRQPLDKGGPAGSQTNPLLADAQRRKEAAAKR